MSEGFPPTIWRTVMEDRREVLEEKLVRLLREAAEVEVELSRVEGAIVGIPHYFAHRVQGPPILTELTSQSRRQTLSRTRTRGAKSRDA
jgi:hypothetical protein